MVKIYSRDLKRGQTLETVFLVSEKILTKTKTGNPYLSLRLSDCTGEVEGRVWENASDLAALFGKNDFIRIRAEVDEFQGSLQLRILRLARCTEAEIRLEDFLPHTSQDIEKMYAEVKGIALEIRNPFLRRLLEAFFADEDFVKKFKTAPAAKGVHHVFIGGLLEHTLAVAQLLKLIAPRYAGIDADLLITAGILHDVGKTSELSSERNFDYTDEGRLLGHILIGLQMTEDKLRTVPGFPEPLALHLKHMLLSHHGEYAFGSPKRPKTVEALLLHQLDDLDAKVNGFLASMEKEKENPSRWTSYNKIFERFLFKPEEPGK
jgi:3'-5' exoribonuclease